MLLNSPLILVRFRMLFLIIAMATAVFLAPGCSKSETTPATADNVSGTWFLQCRTKNKSATSCQSREKRESKFVLSPGGKLKRTTDGFDACTTSTWTLSGDDLMFECRGGGMTLKDHWKVQLVEGRMVLYNPDRNWGRVLVRDRAARPQPKGISSAATKIQRTLGQVDYTVTIPAGYFLAEETSATDRFNPEDDSRVSYRFKFGHAASAVGKRGVCRPDRGLSRGDDGAMSSSCVDKPAGVYRLSCWAQRSDQGALTDLQFAEAQTVCGTVSLK